MLYLIFKAETRYGNSRISFTLQRLRQLHHDSAGAPKGPYPQNQGDHISHEKPDIVMRNYSIPQCGRELEEPVRYEDVYSRHYSKV